MKMKSLLMVWSLLGDSMKEQWREIENYEDYLISDQGRVFSYKRSIFLKPANNGSGYLFVVLHKNGIGKSHTIHRLVATAFILNPENKFTVNHIDGCKTNNLVSNLEWNTYSENNQHAMDTGLQDNKGEKHGLSKLSEEKVKEIRKLYATDDFTLEYLGKKFGVCFQLISLIVRRKIWKHI